MDKQKEYEVSFEYYDKVEKQINSVEIAQYGIIEASNYAFDCIFPDSKCTVESKYEHESESEYDMLKVYYKENGKEKEFTVFVSIEEINACLKYYLHLKNTNYLSISISDVAIRSEQFEKEWKERNNNFSEPDDVPF